MLVFSCSLLFCQSAELVSLRQDIERQKEVETTQELKTKWYLNQLNIETEAHKVINKKEIPRRKPYSGNLGICQDHFVSSYQNEHSN